MKTQAIGLLVIMLATIFLLTSCFRIEKQLANKLILYNLSDAEGMEVGFQSTTGAYAEIDTETVGGLKVKGTIMLSGRNIQADKSLYPYKDYQELLESIEELNESDSISVKNKFVSGKTLPELFGYSPNYPVAPKGFATLQVGDNIVADIVFYHLDYKLYYGSGMGVDNNGSLYKVYLVTEGI